LAKRAIENALKKDKIMDTFKCEICGKEHEIYTGIETPEPELIVEFSDEEKEKRVKEFDGTYVVDSKTLFMKGEIFLYLKGDEEPYFSWPVWASFSLKDFQSKHDVFKEEQTIELDGVLESSLPFYEKTRGLKSKIFLNINYDYSTIKIEEKSEIKDDQTEGITEDRIVSLMQKLYHSKGNKKFEKPFATRLAKEIDLAEKKSLSKNENFLIDISLGSILFQIVHTEMLEINNENTNGFGLHLSFDESFKSSQVEIANFKRQDYLKEFNYHNLDGIPTYQIDLGRNKERIVNLVSQIIVAVYEIELEFVEVEYFEFI